MSNEKIFVIFLCLVTGAWFLVGEKKSTGEKIGTIFFFIAIYIFYKLLNMERLPDYLDRVKEMIGL